MKWFKTCLLRSLLVIFVFVSARGEASEFKLRGRLHLDAFYGINDADDFSNGFLNRRARLGAKGKIGTGWEGQIEFDFAEGGVDAKDLWIRRSFGNGGRLTIGQYKVPLGLNELTSSNDIRFIERSSPATILSYSRRVGLGYDHYWGNAGINTMFFGRSLGSKNFPEGDMPMGLAFRGVVYPEVWQGVLHLGISVAWEDHMENNAMRFRDRPEARDAKGGSISFLDLQVDSISSGLRSGFEFLFIRGPWSVEAEYLLNNYKRTASSDVFLQGFHVQGSVFLTPHSRAYSKGVPKGVVMDDNTGAWELVARYSHMDMNNEGYQGGIQNNITVGVNYYATSNLRFMGNLIFVNLSDQEISPVLGVLRAQFYF